MSNILVENKDDYMTVYLNGEIDHHSLKTIREEIDSEIDKKRPQCLIFDFAGVTFMDSSGVGLILGRYRIINGYGAEIKLKNLNKQCRKLLEHSGISKILNF